MKKIFFSLSLLFILTSCSEENPIEETTPALSVSTIIRKNYNTATNEVMSTNTTNVVNNKIQSTTTTNPANTYQSVTTYNYVNDKISLVETTVNNILTRKTHYIYDSNDKLIEHRSDSYNGQGQIQYISKVTFNRIQGIIYANWTRKPISSPTFEQVTSSELILDQNLNEIYCKKYDHLNDEYKKMETTYDANNNIIKQEQFLLNQDGTYSNLGIVNYNYGTAINTLAFVNLNSIGKENMMLLYHLGNDSGAVNEFDIKTYSPNALNNFDTSFFIGNDFIVTNQANSNNYCTYSEYNSYSSNVLFAKFSYEFLFN